MPAQIGIIFTRIQLVPTFLTGPLVPWFQNSLQDYQINNFFLSPKWVVVFSGQPRIYPAKFEVPKAIPQRLAAIRPTVVRKF